MPRLLAAAACAVAVLLGGCGGSSHVVMQAAGPTATASPTPADPPAEVAPALPAGWHWETYLDAEVGVPSSWHDGPSSVWQWCLGTSTDAVVDRPGPGPAVGCARPDPALVSKAGQFLAFAASRAGQARPKDIGDRIYLPVGSQAVAIQAAKNLRDRIAATAHVVTGSDANGCPIDHPLAHDLAWRPTGAAVSAPMDVTSISACKYGNGLMFSAGRLSSTRLDALVGTQVLGTVLGALPAGGQDDPGSCAAKYAYGDEAILALVHHGAGPDTSVVLHYSGCDHNGVDDGTVIRALTAADVAPFIAGSNALTHESGGGPSKATALGEPYTDKRHDRAK